MNPEEQFVQIVEETINEAVTCLPMEQAFQVHKLSRNVDKNPLYLTKLHLQIATIKEMLSSRMVDVYCEIIQLYNLIFKNMYDKEKVQPLLDDLQTRMNLLQEIQSKSLQANGIIIEGNNRLEEFINNLNP